MIAEDRYLYLFLEESPGFAEEQRRVTPGVCRTSVL